MAATVTAWIAYAAARGDTVADDTLSAQALVRAGDYILYRYVANLASAYSVESIQEIVDNATYEAAKLELATPGFFTKTFTQSQQKVLTQVDAIKWTPTGNASGTYSEFPTSTIIDAMFEPYINDPDGPTFLLLSLARKTC